MYHERAPADARIVVSLMRTWSVQAIWIAGDPSPIYAKVRPVSHAPAIGPVGATVQIQREGTATWVTAHRIDPLPEQIGFGISVFLALDQASDKP